MPCGTIRRQICVYCAGEIMRGNVYAFMSAQHPDPDNVNLPPKFAESWMSKTRDSKYNASERAVDSKMDFHLKVAARKAKAQCEDEPRDLNEIVSRMNAQGVIFGDGLATRKLPARLAGGGWDGQKWVGWRGVASVDRGHIPNKPHMDRGPFGLYSDYFLMFCGESPT